TRFDCDWSSDVCSSDLVGRLEVQINVGAIFRERRAPVEERGDRRGAVGVAVLDFDFQHGVWCFVFGVLWSVFVPGGWRAKHQTQIGRASWRERACASER